MFFALPHPLCSDEGDPDSPLVAWVEEAESQ